MSDDFATTLRERARSEVSALPVGDPDVEGVRRAADAAERRQRQGWVAGALCLVLVVSVLSMQNFGEDRVELAPAEGRPATVDDVIGRHFESGTVEGAPVVGSTVRLSFVETPNGTQVQIGSDPECNGGGSGPFSLGEDGRLRLTDGLFSTRRGCSDVSQTAMDEWTSGLLESSPTIELTADGLMLHGPVMITFMEVPPPGPEPTPTPSVTPMPAARPGMSPPQDRPAPGVPAAAAGMVDGRDAAVLASAPALADSYALHALVANTGEGWLSIPSAPPLVSRWDGQGWVDVAIAASGGNSFQGIRPGQAAEVSVEPPLGESFEPGWYQVRVIVHAGADPQPVFDVAALTLVPQADTDVLDLLSQLPQRAEAFGTNGAPGLVVTASSPDLGADLAVSVRGDRPAVLQHILAFPYIDGIWAGPVTVGERRWGQRIDPGATLDLHDPWDALDPDLLYQVRVFVRSADDDSPTAPVAWADVYVGGRP